MATKRIIDQPTDTALSPGDLIIVDSEESGVGTRKFDLGAKLGDIDTDIADIKQDLSDLDDRVEALEEGGGGGSGITAEIKQALLACFQHIAFLDDEDDYYQDLYDALYSITSISLNTTSLSFSTLNSTQQLTATTTPTGGAVTWTSSNTSVATVSTNGFVTSVGYGNATITATSGSVSATCSVVITQATLVSISATYTQSGTVYDTDSLDDLESDLVVTAHYDDQTTSTVTTYTLSGTLTAGTSTITVSYNGKTTTFNVTVTHYEAQETKWISGYSDNNSTQAKAQYAPFYLASTYYTYDYTKKISSIELNVHTIGNLTIGHQDESTISTSSSVARTNHVVDETITLTETGKQKITLSTPIQLTSGQVLAIGSTSDTAVFLYGTNGTDKGFKYCGSSNVTANTTNSLGLDVYVQ